MPSEHRPSGSPSERDGFVLEQWDDAPLCREIFVLNNVMMRTAERFVTDLGLTSSRWLLLGAIDDHEQAGDCPSVSDLSQNALLLSVQNVSRMLASVEAEGLVQRFNVPGKGRSVFVRLTDEGRSCLNNACERGEGFVERLLEGFDPADIEHIRTALTQLVGNLDGLSHDLDTGRVDVARRPSSSSDTDSGESQ